MSYQYQQYFANGWHSNAGSKSELRRKTKQREIIAACFTAADRPLAPTEAHELVVAELPTLGIATVYRFISAFVEKGILVPVVIGGTTRYESADKNHHHHFYCRQCDTVFCLDDCPLSESRLAPRGYKVESHDLVVNGFCRECSRKNREELRMQ
jgi:Fur family ferric uptake transcriptional regulator